MRIVRRRRASAIALAGARREAAAAFGDDRLILERLVEGPRHVEIQVLFDAHGHGVHLGERDCSLQRRHQKVLEETPSPAVDPEPRERLGAAALELASAVGYVGAGTCEFLLDRPRRRLLPRDEHAPPGGAPGHRARHRAATSSPTSSGSPAGEPLGFEQGDVDAALPAAATPSRCASTRRTPRTGSCRRPGGSRRSAGRPARASASMPGSTRARGHRPLRPDARQDHRPRRRPRRGAGTAGDGPRRDGRPRADDEPPVPALARPRAGRPRRPGADRHARPDLAARRLGRADRHSRGGMADGLPRARCRQRVRWRLNVRRGCGSKRTTAPSGPSRPGRIGRRAEAAAGHPPRGHPTTSPSSVQPASRTSTSDGRSVAFPPRPAAGRGPGGQGGRRPARQRADGVLAPMPGSVLAVHVASRHDGRGRRPDRDARGDEDGARRGGADRGHGRELAVRQLEQVARGQLLAIVEP